MEMEAPFDGLLVDYHISLAMGLRPRARFAHGWSSAMMPEEKKFILFPENLNVSLGCPSLQMICYIAGNSLNLAVGTRRSTFAGNSALLPSNVIEFCNVTGWEILAGNSFIGTCHVTLKRPMRAQAVGKTNCFFHQKFWMDNIKKPWR